MRPKIVLIGASTGGPGHLKKILCALPPTYGASIIIAQHMNSAFIPSFVAQFQSELALKVCAIEGKIPLNAGEVLFCPHNCILSRTLGTLCAEPYKALPTPYNPNIDTLFLSALTLCKEVELMVVLLTGIGQDGALGISELQKAGATCIAESEESAIVFGMPKRAREMNPAITAQPLDTIIQTIKTFGER